MTIGSYAFDGRSSLKEVHITDLAKWCAISFISLNPCFYAHHLYLNGEEIKDLVIPNGVTTIGGSAFSGCSSLTSVTIPNSVTTIGESAFYNCSSLTSVTIPDSVTTIEGSAFSGCSSLSSVTIPDSVTTMGENAFYNCSSLTSVTIPDSVTTIGGGAFSGCSSLTSVTIPDSVTTVGENAFYNCSSLTSITIPESVASMGDYVFSGCSSLKEIIGWRPGECPTNVERIVISDSVTTIKSYAFYGCSSLTSVTIPDSVTTIGGSAFWGCKSLATVYVEKGDTERVKELMRGKGIDVETLEFVEVDGAMMSIPQTWADTYPKFKDTFGDNFAAALTKKSGKIAAGGREMLVWEDYVAGTDPTDPDDKFTASVTIVDGKPVVSYTPELDDARKALRKYTTYGKVKLTDTEWTVVPEGHEADYNFFKVTVEMK